MLVNETIDTLGKPRGFSLPLRDAGPGQLGRHRVLRESATRVAIHLVPANEHLAARVDIDHPYYFHASPATGAGAVLMGSEIPQDALSLPLLTPSALQL